MEAVLGAAVGIQVERHWRKLLAVTPTGDLHGRLRSLVRRRADLFDAIAPVRRAASRAAKSSPTLTHHLDRARRALRSQLLETFAAELGPSAGTGNGAAAKDARARETLDALEVATSFETWDHLRRVAGRSKDASRRAVERLAQGVLETSTDNRPRQPAARDRS
jgi:hypothetical protein